ncbi:hypothetical protein AAFF_G00151540 [Aldrovandia affinis]|uniref:Uncharacterized protein n=1 Tax=Aldrovandia affinis TaxID=143900 RepID=A0AAD7R150_9TELE|nr:hypothetical protein AAFF_G00151540 [Aldrovandia affinis]
MEQWLGSAMLAVAEAYYAELFSRRAMIRAEAALLDCVSARLRARRRVHGGGRVTGRSEGRCCPYGTASRAGHDGLPKEFYNASGSSLARPTGGLQGPPGEGVLSASIGRVCWRSSSRGRQD